MSAEQAKAEVGELKRLFRDMLVTITWGLDGKRTSADCVAHLKLVARNSKLYQFNSAPAQPMRELIRQSRIRHTLTKENAKCATQDANVAKPKHGRRTAFRRVRDATNVGRHSRRVLAIIKPNLRTSGRRGLAPARANHRIVGVSTATSAHL